MRTDSNIDKKTFDLEKYGMIICPDCYGVGFILNDEGRKVCARCGGFGFIKKETDSKDNKNTDRKTS